MGRPQMSKRMDSTHRNRHREYTRRRRDRSPNRGVHSRHRSIHDRSRMTQYNRQTRRQHYVPNASRLPPYRSTEYKRRRESSLLRKSLDSLETKEPCEIILALGGNIASLENYLNLADSSESIHLKLLNIFEKGFKSMSTPALLLNVINTMVEKEFLSHTVNCLKNHFKNKRDNTDYLHAVEAVLRILIRVYKLNPSAITFILGSFNQMSVLIKTMRDSMNNDEAICEFSEKTLIIDRESVANLEEHPDALHKTDESEEVKHEDYEEVNATEDDNDTVDNQLFEKNSRHSGMHLCQGNSSRMHMTFVEDLFKTLEQEKQESISKCMKRKETDETGTEAVVTPKESFREIPIFPRLEDLNGAIKPQLRVNKAKGGYTNVDDYLDVQFRLLREDFLEPLREGISAYMGHISGKKKKKIQDIKVYENVRIESFTCGDGLNYALRFGNSKLKRIRWNMTKRLKYGSLVCLSADNFNTCYFATVVNNDIKIRKEGRVHVKFAQHSEQIKRLIGSTFVMIESTAYFEAYRPVLASLQTITENDLPFKEYIIECKREVLPPRYLLRSQEECYFDLRPLLEPDVEIYSDYRSFNTEDRTIALNGMFSEESRELKHVNILESKWPKEDRLQLDSSQRNAIKTALTKEFSVIQGPPGCGKTHIGLEITKVLLHNKHMWRQENGSQSQLLVVCYTNHALDQFLEGISSFYQGNILRVGSRSANENMGQYNLKAIKAHFRKTKAFPIFLYKSRISAHTEVNKLQYYLNFESAKIHCLQENIIHEKALYHEMGNLYNQFRWLEKRNEGFRIDPWLKFLEGSNIVKWLGILALAEEIQNHIYHGIQSGQDCFVGKMLDEHDFTEHREIVTDTELEIKQLDVTQQRKLADFKDENICLDVEGINNFDASYFDAKKRRRVQRERRAITDKLLQLLRTTKPMSESEAASVGNILSEQFTIENRWKLYLYWVQKKCNKMILGIDKKINKFQAAHDRLKEILMMEDRQIFGQADVIGMTVTGAARFKNVLREIKPTIMIVEEAAEVLESNLVSNLTAGCEQLILIGDHKQLKPKPNVYRLEVDYNLDLSLFERMVRNGIKCDCLQIQHRMRPAIADNVRHIYDVLIDHASVKQYDPVKGIFNDVFFIDHCSEEKKDEELKSCTNEREAKYIIALCKYLLLQGYEASTITVLTMYRGQMFMLKKEMLQQGDALKGVRMTVVDDYQGEENDIILLSLVRSNSNGLIGFLKRENRICVALSRAKKGLYVIGNFGMLAEASPLWKTIINGMRQKGLVGKELQLRCQNHPNDIGLLIKDSTDFEAVPGGGCGKICDARLDCGHTCDKYCHVKNQEHRNIVCMKPCAKTCPNGHRCMKLCWQDCYCEEKIIVTLPKCGHIVYEVCSIDIENYVCNETCKRKLDCGHECNRMCRDPCKCMVPVKVTLPGCGHEATIPCSVKPNQHKCTETIQILRSECGHLETVSCNASRKGYCQSICNLSLDCGHLCQEKCGTQMFQQENDTRMSVCPRGHESHCDVDCKEVLKCGHSCKGKCSVCFNGRWHQQCVENCTCELVCGHSCKGKCGYCLPCNEKCSKRCSHQLCEKRCIETCSPCKHICKWKCEHFSCTLQCGQVCNRPRCDKPCEKLLPCKHKCIGMCGDPCPIQCHICNKEDISKISFGHTGGSDARFVQLPDCGHLIEYEIMDNYMDTFEGVCLKRCPLCGEPVKTTMGNRYESVVNKITCRVNKCKKEVLQDIQLFNILNESVKNQGNVPKILPDPEYRDLSSSHSYHSTGIFTFFDCRGVLYRLNLMIINNFIRTVFPEQMRPKQNEMISFPFANICPSSQKLQELEREVKKYLDKCMLHGIANVLKSQEHSNLEVKEILTKANGILSERMLYTEVDRKQVQAYINELPEISKVRKRLLSISIKAVDIDRDTVVRDGGIDVESFYKADVVPLMPSGVTTNQEIKATLTESKTGICCDEEQSGFSQETDTRRSESTLLTNCDEETVHVLRLLTWSGYPYFNSKRSQFRHALNSDVDSSRTGVKRKGLNVDEEDGPRHKIPRSVNECNNEETSAEDRTCFQTETDEIEPKCKRAKYDDAFESDHNHEETAISDVVKKKTQTKDDPAALDIEKPDIRKVFMKVQPQTQLDTTEDGLVNRNFHKIANEAPRQAFCIPPTQSPSRSTSGRSIVEYSDIEMYTDPPEVVGIVPTNNNCSDLSTRKMGTQRCHSSYTDAIQYESKSHARKRGIEAANTLTSTRQEESFAQETVTSRRIDSGDLRHILNKKKRNDEAGCKSSKNDEQGE